MKLKVKKSPAMEALDFPPAQKAQLAQDLDGQSYFCVSCAFLWLIFCVHIFIPKISLKAAIFCFSPVATPSQEEDLQSSQIPAMSPPVFGKLQWSCLFHTSPDTPGGL